MSSPYTKDLKENVNSYASPKHHSHIQKNFPCILLFQRILRYVWLCCRCFWLVNVLLLECTCVSPLNFCWDNLVPPVKDWCWKRQIAGATQMPVVFYLDETFVITISFVFQVPPLWRRMLCSVLSPLLYHTSLIHPIGVLIKRQLNRLNCASGLSFATLLLTLTCRNLGIFCKN